MKTWGAILIAAGILAALAGVFIDPTIATTDPAAYEIFGANMPHPLAPAIKAAIIAAGAMVAQTGIILFGIGIVGDKVDALRAAIGERNHRGL